jgi:hypothetical protein
MFLTTVAVLLVGFAGASSPEYDQAHDGSHDESRQNVETHETHDVESRQNVGKSVGITDDPVAFAVSVSPITAYVAHKSEQIEANGKQYFLSDSAPRKVDAVLIVTEGDHKNWIVVRKVSGGRSVKLTPFQKNQFLFEHSGNGEYEVTSLDKDSEPLFDYFIVGDDMPENPDDPEKPVDPPPVADFAELIKVATDNANSDLETRKQLGTAWLAILGDSKITDARLKIEIGNARANVLSFVRDQDGSWNKWLLAVDNWFKTAKPTDYRAAMAALSKWMIK